jgi:hypothetical protein
MLFNLLKNKYSGRILGKKDGRRKPALVLIKGIVVSNAILP